MEKIAALVVTYNRKEKLRKNINSLLKQSYKLNEIYIIDNNSTDGTKEYINDLIEDNKIINYVKLPENVGGSGGFSKGIEIITNNKNSDYIWGMDDDAYPNKDALKNIIKVKSDNTTCYYSNSNNDMDDYIDNCKEVYDWMFVGFFIPISIVEKIGLPRNDFFIYHDDSEYAYRIVKNNFKIIKVKNSIIVHDNNVTADNTLSKRILKKTISIPKIPNWKMYYFVRNHILLYGWNDSNKYKVMFIILLPFLIRVLLINPKQFSVAFKGYIHGIMGLSGKRMMP